MDNDKLQKQNKNNSLYTKDQHIDILNEELYYKNKEFDQRKRRTIHGRNINLEHEFSDDDYKKELKKRKKTKLPTSFFKKIFFVVLFLFITTAVIAALSLYKVKESVNKDLISMEILGQPFIDGGETLKLKVRIQNFNEQDLELPDLVLSYSKDSSRNEDEIFLRRSLQNIKKGQRSEEDFEVTLFGQEGDVRDIHAVLEYRIAGSSSIFVKNTDHSVVIRSTPTQITLEVPEQIVQDQEIEVKIDVASNTTKQINDVLLNVDYPLGFEFISSNVPARFRNNTWYFPNITDEKQNITITGKLSALPGQGQSFHARLGKQNALSQNEIETVFNTETGTVEVQQSFVTAHLKINNEKNLSPSIRGGDDVDVEIEFKNTLEKTLADVQIIAHLDGDLYTANGIRVQGGDFDSNTNRIVWNKTNVNQLEFLDPGETGTLSFALKTRDLVGANNALVNPQINILVDVSAIEINGKIREAFAVSRADISANSDLSLITKTLHNDGPFKNSGPVPPRVGNKTKYTVTLQVTNSSNDVNTSEVTTFLPPYVTWLGNIAPSVERQKVTYNDITRKVTWDLGTLKSGLGIGTANPKQMSFQVEVLPSLTHVGTNLDITRDIVLSGTDSFTDVQLEYKKIPLTTMSNEPSASSGNGKVLK